MSAVYLGSSQLSLSADRKACLALRRCGQFNFVSTTVVTSLTITALSFERYVACLHSFQLDTIFSSKRVSYGLFIIWGLGGVLGVATALFSPVSQTIKLGDGNSMVQTIIPLFVFPSSLIIILVQLRLYLLSRTKSTDVAPVPDGTNNAEVAEFRKRQIRIAIVAGLTALLYLLCFIPVSFFILLQTQGVDSDTGKFQMIVFGLRMANGIIDPLLYGIGIKDTRKAVMRELRSFKVAVLERLQSSNVWPQLFVNEHSVRDDDIENLTESNSLICFAFFSFFVLLFKLSSVIIRMLVSAYTELSIVFKTDQGLSVMAESIAMASSATFKCRKCRHLLFSSDDLSPVHAQVPQCSSWYLKDDDMLLWVQVLVDEVKFI